MSYEITMNTGKIKIVFVAVIAIAVVAVMGAASVQIVPAGYRGVLLHWSAVDTSQSMSEGLHFVTPFQDQIVPIEVRTLKYEADAGGASKDLQDVKTKVAVNQLMEQCRKDLKKMNRYPEQTKETRIQKVKAYWPVYLSSVGTLAFMYWLHIL